MLKREEMKIIKKNPRKQDIDRHLSPSDIHFDGYAVRYLRPDITKSWKVGANSSLLFSMYFFFLYTRVVLRVIPRKKLKISGDKKNPRPTEKFKKAQNVKNYHLMNM